MRALLIFIQERKKLGGAPFKRQVLQHKVSGTIRRGFDLIYKYRKFILQVFSSSKPFTAPLIKVGHASGVGVRLSPGKSIGIKVVSLVPGQYRHSAGHA